MKLDELTEGLERITGSDWTRFARWFHGSERLVGVYEPEYESNAWELLAFGLEYRKRLGVAQLELVLPPDGMAATAARAAFLTNPPTLLQLEDDTHARLASVSEQEEAIGWFAQLGGVRLRASLEPPPDYWPDWLLDLADWAESRRTERFRPGKEEKPSSVWTWQYRGRQVLKVSGKRKFNLIAGKAYGNPKPHQIAPTKGSFTAGDAVTDEDLKPFRDAVDEAIEQRRLGLDSGHRESLLQAAIGVDPGLVGMSQVVREWPAWRPQGEGSIDFLGIDDDGGLHAIETKIGDLDHKLGLQGLDYWAWMTAHREEHAERLGQQLGVRLDSDQPVGLRYVLGTNEKGLIHRAALATIEALDPEAIPWRIQVIDDWDTLSRSGRLLTPDTLWVGRVHELPPREPFPA